MSQQEQVGARELIRGVFSSQEVKRIGTGTTSRKTIQKAFWFCEEQPDGEIEVQPINPNFVPSGPKKRVTREQFLVSFSPEPEIYVTNVYPKMRELNKVVARGDRHRSNKEYYSAEMEYGTALKVDEENIRANFGLGITYLERGDNGKANNIFERLVKLEAAFEKEHKHLFNEFGINLRKSGMVDQALAYYQRALELTSEDENLYHNLARAYLEKKDVENALTNLLKSLELNPTMESAAKFLLWMVSKNLVPASRKQEVAEGIKRVKQAQSGEPVKPVVSTSSSATASAATTKPAAPVDLPPPVFAPDPPMTEPAKLQSTPGSAAVRPQAAPVAKAKPAPVKESVASPSAPAAKAKPAPVKESVASPSAPAAKAKPAPVKESVASPSASAAETQPESQPKPAPQAPAVASPLPALHDDDADSLISDLEF